MKALADGVYIGIYNGEELHLVLMNISLQKCIHLMTAKEARELAAALNEEADEVDRRDNAEH